MANTTARGVRVPDKLWQSAKAKAASRGETVTDVVTRALDRYTRDDTTARVRTARADYEAHAITEEQLLVVVAAAVEDLADR